MWRSLPQWMVIPLYNNLPTTSLNWCTYHLSHLQSFLAKVRTCGEHQLHPIQCVQPAHVQLALALLTALVAMEHLPTYWCVLPTLRSCCARAYDGSWTGTKQKLDAWITTALINSGGGRWSKARATRGAEDHATAVLATRREEGEKY